MPTNDKLNVENLNEKEKESTIDLQETPNNIVMRIFMDTTGKNVVTIFKLDFILNIC